MRHARIVLGLWVALAVAGLSGCTSGSAPSPSGTVRTEEGQVMSGARPSGDVFSGREPPEWRLTADEARAVRQSIQALPPGTRPMPDVGLGYRGFDVTWEDGAHAKVYRDVVSFTEGGRTVVLQDVERKLEQRLLSGARQNLEPDLFNRVAPLVEAQ